MQPSIPRVLSDMMALLDGVWPYLVMCGSAFLAATVLPYPSEAVLIAQIKAGYGLTWGLVTAATVGNVGGSLCNWWLGGALLRFEGRRWFPFNAYGVWVLLLAWVPIVGDPLTLVAGVLRVPLWTFIPLVTIGKCARYIVVAWLV
jgi:membrane protein YqaA with SNARE-associated domain